VDADVLEWLKAQGKGYQSRINAILRREMLAAHRSAAAREPADYGTPSSESPDRGHMAPRYRPIRL
jgi:hypothetical protein